MAQRQLDRQVAAGLAGQAVYVGFLDLDALAELSSVARKAYGLGGAVQHGASTLPLDAFDAFPRVGACEIHLATDFQNMVYDHPDFPAELKAEMYAWLQYGH